jgi:Lamin Tail Domain
MKKLLIFILPLLFVFGACDDDSSNNTNNTTNPVCNNGTLEQGEVCDSTQLDAQACDTLGLGYTGGTLSCNNSCTFDTSLCTADHVTCGNDVIEGLEVCEGTNLNGATCESLAMGYTGGDLACDSCSYDVSGCTAAAVCGDNECNGTETVTSCPEDCEVVAPFCGDDTCNGTETAETCPADCGVAAYCGDGTCLDPENQTNCATDCGTGPYCGDGTCLAGTEDATNCYDDCGSCGDTFCTGTEDATSCYNDCASCGDNTCDSTETVAGCYADCGSCGDSICTAGSEDATSCYDDCANCGDNTCDSTETAASCYDDCGSCGDNSCDGTETPANCLGDCPVVCGDNSCDGTETGVNCYADCGSCGDNTCEATETPLNCPGDCPGTCGDTYCTPSESMETCYDDCGGSCGDTICSRPDEDFTTCATDCLTEEDPTGIYEQFFADYDIGNKRITFTPNGGTYDYVVEDSIEFYVDPGTGTATSMYIMDDETHYTIPLNFDFPFYDKTFTTAFVSSNGRITFNYTESDWQTGAAFFDQYQVALWWADLEEVTGDATLYVDEGMDGGVNYWAFTYYAQDYTTDAVFWSQVVFFSDGRIIMDYSNDLIGMDDAIVGIAKPGDNTNYPAGVDFVPAAPNVGEVIFTEFMYDTSAPLNEGDAEWVEIYNTSAFPRDLTGCTIYDAGANSITVGDLVIQPGEYVVFARSTDSGLNGGIVGAQSLGGVALNNTGVESITLECGGNDIDMISYDDPNPANFAVQLNINSYNSITNDASENPFVWCAADAEYFATTPHYGTPGAANKACGTTLFTEPFDDMANWTITNDGVEAISWATDTVYNSTYPGKTRTFNLANGEYARIDSDAPEGGIVEGYMTLTNPVDCSGMSIVMLSYNFYYNDYNATDWVIVEVSTDGAIWTQVALYDGADIETSENIDITAAIAGDPQNVQVRFWYTGDYSYFFLVDDVIISGL